MKSTKELEALLKESGVPDPKTKLAAMAEKLKDKGVADTDITKILQKSVMAFASAQKRGLSPYRGVCIGVSAKRDILAGARRNALDVYGLNPEQALVEGFVRIEGDQVIPLDVKEKFGDRPNPNFGKPMKVVVRRNSVFISEKDLYLVSGNYDIKPGMKYTFWGSMSDGDNSKITGAKNFTSTGAKLNPQDVWEKTRQVCEDSPVAVDMAELGTVKDNVTVAILGYVTFTGDLDEGIYAILTDYESGAEVICFASGVTEVMDNTQVIVVGRKFTTIRDGEKNTAIDAVAMIHNPSAELSAEITEELDTILMEE